MPSSISPSKFSPSTNPSPLKIRLARAFLRALARVNSHRNLNPSSPMDTLRKYRRVRIAAYASMASAVGVKRAWSRSILRKIGTRAQHNLKRFVKEKDFRRNVLRKRKKRSINITCENRLKGVECGACRHENKLRKLVPGGENLEFGCLLDETADYIKCLATQVQVMRSIADFYSV